MGVEDYLTCCGLRIDSDVESVCLHRSNGCFCHLLCVNHHVFNDIIRGIEKVCAVLLWHDKRMACVDWIDIEERKNMVVLEHYVCRNLLFHYLAENALAHFLCSVLTGFFCAATFGFA